MGVLQKTQTLKQKFDHGYHRGEKELQNDI